MTRLELIRQVALRMDEVTPESPDFTIADIPVDGSDNNPLYALIDGLVDAGALELFSVAPFWRLPQKAFTGVAVKTLPALFNSRKVVRLKVEDDFLRVAEIDCVHFQRPVTEVFPEVSDQGKRQHNRFLMGKEAKPVGVMSHDEWTTGSGSSAVTAQCREIDCYSIDGSTTVNAATDVKATYIATPTMPSVESDTEIETVVPPVLVEALEWLVAARTFGARGDANHAAICQQNAQNLLV